MTAVTGRRLDEDALRPENTQERASTVDAPRLVGDLTYLRPIRPEDHDFLYYGLYAHPENQFRSRLHIGRPGKEEFLRALWDMSYVQMIASLKESRTPFACFVGYGANLHDGYSNIELVTVRDASVGPATREAASMFVDYLFALWPFRKLYTYCNEITLEECRRHLGESFQEEARLVAHEYYDDRFWDSHILGVFRQEWEAAAHLSTVGDEVPG